MSTSNPPALDIGQTLARAQAHWNAGQADQAEMACAQVLAVWPGQSDAMHLMGLMAHAYGNLDLAIANLRQACQSPRAPALYYSNFAEMCRQRGLLAEGEQAARRAVAINPQLAGGWNNLGILLQESGKLDESRACLERMLALEPDNAQALNNLANTCKRLGRPEEAERLWMRAIGLQPNYAEVYSNLSNLLVERSKFDRARELARQAIDLNPRLADAYINLAAVEVAEHRFKEALRWLRALLDFAPDHVGGLVALAFALRQCDEPEAALEAAQRAVSLSPESAEAANALGGALQACDAPVAAVAAFTRAASLPGITRAQSLGNIANLNMEIGRKDVAQTQYEALVAEYPLSASGWFNLASLRRVKAGDVVIERLRAVLQTGSDLSANDQMLVHFGLGKALGDIGDSVGAFHHFDIGNRLKRATISYDADGVSQWMREIAAAYPATSLEGQGGCPSAMPIFVLGMPRSGTTLVEQILASHTAIHGAGELRFLQQMVEGVGAFPRDFTALTAGQRTQFGEAYAARLAKLARGHAHVVDKMPANFLYAGLIRQMLPGARIIHCRRDPVDTCLSCYSNLFAGEQAFTYDQVELGRFHRDYQELMAHWRAILPETHFLEVDYEAVVDDLEGQARRMLAFLGLPWDPACLEFHRTERPVRTASVNQVREPIYRSSTGKWRQHAAQLQPLLGALGIAAP